MAERRQRYRDFGPFRTLRVNVDADGFISRHPYPDSGPRTPEWARPVRMWELMLRPAGYRQLVRVLRRPRPLYLEVLVFFSRRRATSVFRLGRRPRP